MATIILRTTARLRWLPAAASLLAIAMTVAAAVAPAYGTDKLTCGKPTRTGRIKVTVTMQHGADFIDRAKTVEVDSSWSADTKALAIRRAFAADIFLSDTLTAGGAANKVVFTVPQFWRVFNVAVIAPDGEDTGEPDVISLGLPAPEQDALCSLAGTSSGVSPLGGPAFVRVWLGATNVIQQIQPGTPSFVIEQMLIARLNQAGIPARFATAADFAGGNASLPHDAQVIWCPISDSTGFGQELADTGLSIDLHAVFDNSPEIPSASPDATRRVDLWLEANPTVFSSGVLSLRYVTRPSDQWVDLGVFDSAGRRVRRLLDRSSARSGSIGWDGRDDRGVSVPGGVYFGRLQTQSGTLTCRMVRVRG